MLHPAPASLKAAKRYVTDVHRVLDAPPGGLFAVAVADADGLVRGVAIIGRPVAPALQDGTTAEVTRVATDGARNACSLLYGAAWRAGRALGYTRMVTYTTRDEDGRSVASAGWVPTPCTGGGPSWGNRPGRTQERVATTRWTVECSQRPLPPRWPGELGT